MNARDVLARLRLPDGRLWIDAAYPFQIEDARAVLAEDGPPYSLLTRSRGSSKTTDLAGLALAMLLAADDVAAMQRLFPGRSFMAAEPTPPPTIWRVMG